MFILGIVGITVVTFTGMMTVAHLIGYFFLLED